MKRNSLELPSQAAVLVVLFLIAGCGGRATVHPAAAAAVHSAEAGAEDALRTARQYIANSDYAQLFEVSSAVVSPSPQDAWIILFRPRENPAGLPPPGNMVVIVDKATGSIIGTRM